MQTIHQNNLCHIRRQKQETQAESMPQLSLNMKRKFTEMDRHRDFSSAEAAAVARTVIRLG